MPFPVLHMPSGLQCLDRLEVIQTRDIVEGHGTFTKRPTEHEGIILRRENNGKRGSGRVRGMWGGNGGVVEEERVRSGVGE